MLAFVLEFGPAREAIAAPAVQYLIDQVIRYCVIAGDEAVALLAFQDMKFRRSNVRHNRFCFVAPLNWPRRTGARATAAFITRLVTFNDTEGHKFRNSTRQKDGSPVL